MKTTHSLLNRYWRELIIVIVFAAVATAVIFLGVESPKVVVIVAIICALYFIAVQVCRPSYGDKKE
ncbi:hypothetical protein HOS33_gp285 [Erwinia phage vB_EamM_Y3]|uniref:Uncharacterized protein n=1 Tax=Erwinia phage vB_EamM_Y3 TaxID=1983553 RepID=A0A2H4IBJ6_9CAUD|nr:hypothetical protein HOS33_gp285 [Erwinia phage vB_EamM_Y3]ARW58925.1 hypothetical protein Y3_285 [Erwinia phage vB_EamM_Y3]